jgi:hypothetical protein
VKNKYIFEFVFNKFKYKQPILYFSLACIFSVIVFWAGESFGSFFEYTDGQTYLLAFESLRAVSPTEAYLSFVQGTGGAELLSFLVFYIFSQFTDIAVANNILNTILILVIFLLLRKKSANVWCWMPFLITNYYILLIGFGALRLKIAVLFLLLSWLTKSESKRWMLVLASVLSHFQMFIPLCVFIAERFVARQSMPALKFLLILVIVILGYQYEAILGKLIYYANYLSAPPYKLIALSLISLILIDRRKTAVVMMAIFIPISFVIGDGRLNIMYIIMITHEYLSFSKRNVFKSIVLILCATYLSVKGIYFAQSLLGGYSFFEE